MSRKKSVLSISIVAVLLFVGLALFYRVDFNDFRRWGLQISERFTRSPDDLTPQVTAEKLESPEPVRPPMLRPIPKPGLESADKAFDLPPSPPLPQVPAESSQSERKQAFGLGNSVDHIILKDEPFEVAGKTFTIDHIQSEIQGSKTQFDPATGQPPAGPEAPYYGVRIVQPSENVWKIHFGILREYLARRQVILPKNADRPLPGGRSSGVSRLLKFIESVVVVYNTSDNRIEKNINLVQPHSVVIFFKISDLFKALDQMQPEDWKWLRYVKGSIRVNRPGQTVELIDRRSLE
jgi:hypothetical protein